MYKILLLKHIREYLWALCVLSGLIPIQSFKDTLILHRFLFQPLSILDALTFRATLGIFESRLSLETDRCGQASNASHVISSGVALHLFSFF